MVLDDFRHRGFLPPADPLRSFPDGSPYRLLDEVGEALPERLKRDDFRCWAEGLEIPCWETPDVAESFPELCLYYVRLGFLASGYVHQVGAPCARRLPSNIALPLYAASQRLKRPPILSYDGYALYNWMRLDPSGPVALGNIDTIQNFVDLYDEHWFIAVHVEIEALAAEALSALLDLAEEDAFADGDAVDAAIEVITKSLRRQIRVLRRIPEKMSPDRYFREFRPYICYFENVVYEGVDQAPMSFRGETGAQSSVVPALVAFFKIPHAPSALTNHLADMGNYMPSSHRALVERIEQMPDVKGVASADQFNAALEALAEFREVHYGWARIFIDQKVSDPRGTGGTPYMRWLDQLIDETRAHQIRS
ncbi:MAG: hypothetical protein V3U43_04610 [Pseudomonadales bacterium]